MLLSYSLALLSKENSLILPALLLLYHYSFKERIKAKQFFSILCLAVVYIAIRITVLKAVLDAVDHSTTLLQRLPGFFVAVTTYIRLLFLPFDLHMEYGYALFHWRDPKSIFGIILFIVLLTYAFRKKQDHPLVFFSILWFFVALLPVSNLYPINAYMAEHWLYVPSVGFFLIIAQAISLQHRAKDFRIPTVIFAICLLSFYSFLTIRQNIFWREPISFYERTLKYAPNSLKVHYNLGIAYKDINKNEEAVASYKKAIEINPDFAGAYYNLGLVYKDMNKGEEAVALFKKAIDIKPDYAEAYNNLGVVYIVMNQKEEAVALFTKAIEIKADYADPYNNLGFVYATMDKNEKAVNLYKKAIGINAHYADAYYNLAIGYIAMNKKGEALALYKKTIEINPNYAKAYNNLSAIYFEQKQYKLAIEYCDKARELGFSNPALLEALKPYRK